MDKSVYDLLARPAPKLLDVNLTTNLADLRREQPIHQRAAAHAQALADRAALRSYLHWAFGPSVGNFLLRHIDASKFERLRTTPSSGDIN